MRALIILLITLLLGGASASGAHKVISSDAPERASTTATASVIAKGTGRGTLAPRYKAHIERRLQKLVHRIWQALPDEERERIDTNSLLALICGVVALISLPFFPLLMLLSIPALVLGIVGLEKTKREGMKGKGLAIAGNRFRFARHLTHACRFGGFSSYCCFFSEIDERSGADIYAAVMLHDAVKKVP